MTRTYGERIGDMFDTCAELAQVVALRSRGGTPDVVLLRAAERLLEILGEAATQASEVTRARYSQVDWGAWGGFGSCWPTSTTGPIRI